MDWFALIVRPKHERAVLQQLGARSVEAYVPFYRTPRQWSDRIKHIELPLFPRYVFCRFKFENRRTVLSTLGVASVVSFGGTPSPIPEFEIDRIRRLADSRLPMLPWPFIRVGQPVRISRGSLANVVGIVVREKTVCRVVVNIEILQRAVALEIDRDLLEPVVTPQTPPQYGAAHPVLDQQIVLPHSKTNRDAASHSRSVFADSFLKRQPKLIPHS